jgi:hypothetical protein
MKTTSVDKIWATRYAGSSDRQAGKPCSPPRNKLLKKYYLDGYYNRERGGQYFQPRKVEGKGR